MKVLFLFLSLWSSFAYASLNEHERVKLEAKHKKLKYYLLTGEQTKAYAILKVGSALFQKANLFHYYQAIFSYLENDYEETLTHIKLARHLDVRKRKQICQIQVVSFFMTKKWTPAYNRWRICSRNFEDKNFLDQYFLASLLESKFFQGHPIQPREFRRVVDNPEKLELWLKLGTYLQKSERVEEYIESIPDKYSDRQSLKDVNAQILFDLKRIQLSYEMIADSKTLVATLTKSNLFIYKKRFQEAYDLLLEAYKDNISSKALVSRLVLLSFALKKHEETLLYINHYQKISKTTPLDFYWKKTLILISTHKTKEAKLALKDYMDQLNDYGLNSLVSVRKFMTLQDNDPLESLYYSEKSCRKDDYTGCWLKILLKNNFQDLKDMKIPSDYYQQFIGKINAGWLLPVNDSEKQYSKGLTLNQSTIQRLDQVERTKELFFQD